MNLYLGFEFAPVEGWENIMPSPQAPSNYKDPAKIQAYVEKAIDKLRDGKASIDPLCGTVSRAVVLGLKDGSGTIHKLFDAVDTEEESAGDRLGSFIASETDDRIEKGLVTLFGYKINRAMRLCAIAMLAGGGQLALESHWVLGHDPEFAYNCMPGYVDPVSLIFGSSDVDLVAVSKRLDIQMPQDDAESRAEFACALAGKLGF